LPIRERPICTSITRHPDATPPASTEREREIDEVRR
jgi:hypothetical protein